MASSKSVSTHAPGAQTQRRRQPCVQGTASPERLRLHSRPLGWHAKGYPLWQGQHPILALCCTAHPWQGGQAAALLPRRASLADLCNEVAVLQQPGLAPREGLLGEPRGELGRQSTHAAVEHLHGRERLRGRGQQGRRVSGKSRRRVRACARGKKSRVATLLTSLQTRPVGIIIPLERRPAVAEGRRRRELADRPWRCDGLPSSTGDGGGTHAPPPTHLEGFVAIAVGHALRCSARARGPARDDPLFQGGRQVVQGKGTHGRLCTFDSTREPGFLSPAARLSIAQLLLAVSVRCVAGRRRGVSRGRRAAWSAAERRQARRLCVWCGGGGGPKAATSRRQQRGPPSAARGGARTAPGRALAAGEVLRSALACAAVPRGAARRSGPRLQTEGSLCSRPSRRPAAGTRGVRRAAKRAPARAEADREGCLTTRKAMKEPLGERGATGELARTSGSVTPLPSLVWKWWCLRAPAFPRPPRD